MGFTGIGKGVGGGSGDGTITSTEVVRAKNNYNASVGEHVVMSGGNVVNLPDPEPDGLVMVSKYDDAGSQPEVQDPRTNETIEGTDRVSPLVDYPIVLLSDGNNWYVSDASDTTLVIPDSLVMFDNPVYSFNPDSDDNYSEKIAALSDTSIANGSPVYKTDFNGTGYDYIEYDSSNDESHTWPSDNALPTTKVSVFAAFYTDNTSDNNTLISYGDDQWGLLLNQGNYATNGGGFSPVRGGTYSTGVVDTMGATIDTSSNTVEVYGGGGSSTVATGTQSTTLSDTNKRIGEGVGFYHDGGIFNVTICDGIESGQAYDSYHNFWV